MIRRYHLFPLTVLGSCLWLGLWTIQCVAQTTASSQSTDAAGTITGVPWSGSHGLTETVDQIMAREKQHPFVLSGVREPKPEPTAPQPIKQDNPAAPQVARWPLSLLPPRTGQILGPFAPQTVGTSFLGAQVSESGYVPPDCMGAIGPTQFLVCVNGRIKVFDRSGTVGSLNTGTDVFFASVRSAGTSDPRVRFDRFSSRWFIIMIDVATTNRVLLAVSSGATITGTSSFTFYEFRHDSVGTMPNTDTGGFADYPTLGIDVNALYVGVNVFNAAGTAVIGTTAFVIRKSSVLSGGPIVVTAFRQIGAASGTGGGPWTPQGVDNDDPAATVGYFIGVDNQYYSLLDVRRVSNPGGTPTLSGNDTVNVPTTYYPINVPHLGMTASRYLDALDDRLFVAQIHKNRISGSSTLWTAHNVRVTSTGVASSGGNRDASRWYEITNLSTKAILNQAGTLFDTASGNPRYFWIPSCTMSGQGHVALAASAAGAAEHAEIVISGRLSGDALGTLQAPTTAQLSSTAYNLQSTNPQRWGDFTLVSVDPNDNMTMWTVQQYCNASNSWGVQVIQLKAPAPATPDSAIPASVAQGSSNVNVVIRGTSSGGSGFFDPDVSYPNHITATVSGGGVTVNSVTFTDPTHISVNLTVAPGAALGARTVTVTNPDAQSATSASGILTVSAPLPIELAAFSGSFISNDAVRLEWSTISEVDNYGFEVQRSPSPEAGYHGLTNGFVPGHGTTSVVHHYSYTDLTADTHEEYYRLKQIDLDGTVKYLEGIAVGSKRLAAETRIPAEFSLGQNYPNPFNPATVIRYGLPADATVSLEVYNTLGERMMVLVNEHQQAGLHKVVLENAGLASGVYFYRLQAGSFVQTKKLLLLR